MLAEKCIESTRVLAWDSTGLGTRVQSETSGEPNIAVVKDIDSRGFNCKCGTLVRRPVRVVTETRIKEYDCGSVGSEIAKEQLMCQRCAYMRDGLIR